MPRWVGVEVAEPVGDLLGLVRADSQGCRGEIACLRLVGG